MSTSFTINHHEYGLPAKISFDFDRRDDVVMSSRIEVTAKPSTEIHFWLDTAKHHHGQVMTSLSGGVSPQSRQRELLSYQIANNLYERYITLQKRVSHSPGAAIASLIVSTSTPDKSTEHFISSMPSANKEFKDALELSCKEAIMTFCLLMRLIEKGCDTVSNESIKEGLDILRRKVFLSCRYLSRNGGIQGVSLQALALECMKKEKD